MAKDEKDSLPTQHVKRERYREASTENTSREATASVVTDLDEFEGVILEDKIDTLIDTYPVVMFNRTWCLFSVDAINFLLGLGVSVHSVEVDVHPCGKEIISYIFEKTSHKTTPVIFIKGEFLGGFEEVNSLYAQGKLMEEYLNGLSQADRCEAFLNESNLKHKPYFWFPDKVDAAVVRVTGVLTFFAAVVSLAFVLLGFNWARYIAYVITLDYFLRLLGGAPVSLIGRAAMLLTIPFDPEPRLGRPKQFATILGLFIAVAGSICYLAEFPHHDYVGSAFFGVLAIASFLEGFLDYCIGCAIFRFGAKLRLF